MMDHGTSPAFKERCATTKATFANNLRNNARGHEPSKRQCYVIKDLGTYAELHFFVYIRAVVLSTHLPIMSSVFAEFTRLKKRNYNTRSYCKQHIVLFLLFNESQVEIK